MSRLKKPYDGGGVDELARRIFDQPLDRSWGWPRRRKLMPTTKSAELDLEEEGDVGVGIVILVEIELVSNGSGSVLGVEEVAKYTLGPTGNEDAEGKGGIQRCSSKDLEDFQLILIIRSCCNRLGSDSRGRIVILLGLAFVYTVNDDSTP